MATKTKKKAKKKTKSKKSAGFFTKKRVIAIVLVLAVALSGVLFAVHSRRSYTPIPYEFSKSKAYGIDVSSHNGKIDWKKAAKEIDFAFIRVGCRGYDTGTIFLDKKAVTNMKNAEKAKVPFGVYIYSQAINEKEAVEEAKFLLKNIKGYNVQLPLVFDFEYPTKNGEQIGRLHEADLNKKERTDIINAFCKTVKDAGYTPALYASSYIYRSYISVKNLEKGTVIWVADYNKKVTYAGKYDIWQFSEKGKCNGVSSKYVDTNYWYTGKEDKNEDKNENEND